MCDLNETKNRWVIAVSLLSLLVAASVSAAVPRLSTSTESATAGNFQLSWELENPALQPAMTTPRFELQVAGDGDFSDAALLYDGQDTATVISGLSNGKYFYRVRVHGSAASPWSDPVMVTVEHHSLTKAFMFFAAGAVVFLATIGVIIFSSRNIRATRR